MTKGPTEKERRRGGAVSIGAYEMMETLTARLASTSHALLQGLRWKRIANLFSEAMFELGGAVYVLTVTLPNLELVPLSEEGWGDFITYHAEHSMATGDDEPDAIDEVALEQ